MVSWFDSTGMDRLLQHFGTFLIPFLLAWVSITALVLWPSPYRSDAPTPISFRVLERSDTSPPDFDALVGKLGNVAAVTEYGTRLSVNPHWILFEVPNERLAANIEFASRHGTVIQCWNAQAPYAYLGMAERTHSEGALRAVKAGFALNVEALDNISHVLCRGLFQGPARIEIAAWSPGQLEKTEREFHRASGLLEGGMIMLALFVLVIALINREWTYIVFAGWLFANLRLAMLSAGWDTLWLEHTLPESWIYPTRKLAFTAYYALTVALFGGLFGNVVRDIGHRRLLTLIQLPALPLAIAAVALPYARFLPVLWAAGALCISVIAFLVVRMLIKKRSRAAIWFAMSYGLTLGAALYEIVMAAFGFKLGVGALNHVTGALASSLLASLAIAERMRQDHDLRRAAEADSMRALRKMHDTYHASPVGLFSARRDGELVQFNPALEHMLRPLAFSAQEGSSWTALWATGDWRRVLALAETPEQRELEVMARDKDGLPLWYLVQAQLVDELIEGSLQDITERRRAHDRLRFLADHDPLTELLNRRGMETALLHSFDTIEDGLPVALAYVDLDRFKLVNDLFGHPAGDEVLRQVVNRVRAALGQAVTLARVGGDEFIMLFERMPIHAARVACESVLEAISGQPFGHGDKAFQISASIGLVELSNDMTMRDAIATADRACREAKSGRNGHLVVYEHGTRRMRERLDEFHLTERLGRGLPTDRLHLVMQPIISTTTPFDSMNFEVLLRMRDAENRSTAPSALISAAEANGSMSLLDRWVLSTTLAWLDQHHDQLGRTQFVCVNLSGASLNDERFMHDAFAILAEHERAAHRICIEVTESVALHDLHNTRRFIDGLKTHGAKVALDDFGAGYTSFAYLKELPADALKIDGAFVKGMSEHPANVAIIQAIIELARNLGMKSIAEWVEDARTTKMLIDIGADYLQGYGLVVPQPPRAILDAKSSADWISDAATLELLRRQAAIGGHGGLDVFLPPDDQSLLH
ncbi:MAG TPA: EAL domain-containing protein [Burkholderiaceae bacterium]|nr:EAL domain-containing protein [Burkholderiaceae bacterium]